MSREHTYRYHARLTPGDERPSTWCGDLFGPNVHMLRVHRTMLAARLHAWWRNLRRPAPPPMEPRLQRIEESITTMAWWLVQAQSGFGERDARGIQDILHSPQVTAREEARPPS